MIQNWSGEINQISLVLLHSLWQGVCCALVVWLSLKVIPNRHANARYLMTWAGAVMLGICCSLTLYSLNRPTASPDVVSIEYRGPDSADIIPPLVALETESHTSKTSAQQNAITGQQQTEASWIGQLKRFRFDDFPWLLKGLFLFWIVGVVYHLKGLWSGSETEKLNFAPAPSTNLEPLLASLCEQMGISPKPQLQYITQNISPCVFGCFRTTILLPVSAVTELSEEMLRMAIAHELAHIKRLDPVFHVVQVLGEALFFFNPAVRWMSHQIRQEREAAVDALVTRSLVTRNDYISGLASWAEWLSAQGTSRVRPQMAMANPGTLADRLQRMISPSGHSSPRLSRPMWIVMLAAFIGLGYVGHSGSALVWEKILTPEERAEKFEQLQESIGQGGAVYQAEGEGKFTFKLKKPDGSYLTDKRIDITWLTKSLSASSDCKFDEQAGHFVATTHAGGGRMVINPRPNFAPFATSIIECADGQTVDLGEFEIETGKTASITVVDQDQQPIANASVSFYFSVRLPTGGGGGPHFWSGKSDEQGIANITRIPSEIVHVKGNCKAPGFIPLNSVTVDLETDAPTIAMTPTQLTSGVVLDQQGKAVSEVEILQVRKQTGSSSNSNSLLNHRSNVPKTDAEGLFQLDQLEPGAVYSYALRSPDGQMGRITGVEAGMTNLKVTLEPVTSLQLTIKLSEEQTANAAEYFSIRCTQSAENGGTAPYHQSAVSTFSQRIQSVEQTNVVSMTNLFPGKARIRMPLGTKEIELSPGENHLTWDASKEAMPSLAMREVIVKFEMTEKSKIEFSGSVRINSSPRGYSPASVQNYNGYRDLKVNGNELRFQVAVPGYLSFDDREFRGGKFDRVSENLQNVKEPFRITIPVAPAGAVKGRIVNYTSQRSIRPEARIVIRTRQGGFLKEERTEIINVNVNSQGEFLSPPIALGSDNIAYVTYGYIYGPPVEFRLSKRQPFPEIELPFPKSQTVSFYIQDPDGKPVLGMPCSVRLKRGEGLARINNEWMSNLGSSATGMVQFENVGMDLSEYFIQIRPIRDWQHAEIRLDHLVRAGQFTLQPGMVLRGQLLDRDTKKPLAGRDVEMYEPGNNYYRYNRVDVTDNEGRFEISVLRDRKVRLSFRPASISSDQNKEYTPGIDQDITILAK